MARRRLVRFFQEFQKIRVQIKAPCGAIANSLFNDTFFMYDCDNDDCEVDDATLFARVINPAGTPDDVPIPMTGEDIAWQTDKVRI